MWLSKACEVTKFLKWKYIKNFETQFVNRSKGLNKKSKMYGAAEDQERDVYRFVSFLQMPIALF